MTHNPNKVLLGSTGSSMKEVDNHVGTIAAGIAVRLKSDDTLSIASADGSLLGISLGSDLTPIGYTAICRRGIKVPLKLTAAFSPTIGAAVRISDTTGLGVTSGGTVVNAVYSSGKLSVGGTDPDSGTTGIDVAYIDFPGGL